MFDTYIIEERKARKILHEHTNPIRAKYYKEKARLIEDLDALDDAFNLELRVPNLTYQSTVNALRLKYKEHIS